MQNFVESCEKLIRLIRNQKPKLIGIDGPDGVGKSTLAKKIEDEVNIPHIELDHYLKPKNNEYFNYLDLTKLSLDMNKYCKRFVIEGVMLNKVTKSLNLELNLSIFIVNDVFVSDWIEAGTNNFNNLSLSEILDKEELIIKRLKKV